MPTASDYARRTLAAYSRHADRAIANWGRYRAAPKIYPRETDGRFQRLRRR